MFNHKIHSSEEGYGLSCEDCHHELLEGESDKPVACIECHDPEEGDEGRAQQRDGGRDHDRCGSG